LLIRHSKYSAMLSKIHYYRLLFSAILPTGYLARRTFHWLYAPIYRKTMGTILFYNYKLSIYKK